MLKTNSFSTNLQKDYISRRFFASLAKMVYTFLLAILEMFTFSPIPYCSA